MKIKNVLVLMGGKSAEHEISLLSGSQVVENLDVKRFNSFPVVISKKGEYLYMGAKIEFQKFVSKNKIDIVFIALHGKYGEDGSIQGMLDMLEIPYTGSGLLTSAIGMNKRMFRRIMESEKVLVPEYVEATRKTKIDEISKVFNKYPLFIKPVSNGSSVGASIANNLSELKLSLKKAFEFDERVLIDEYINGTELTCSVVGNETPIALPLIEIRPLKGKFFDYDSKYSESGANEIVPAQINDNLRNEIQDKAIKIYKLLGCRGFSRIDFIVKENKSYVLEINTIPGLTKMSLLPKSALAYGWTYSKLLTKIIMFSMNH